MDKSSCRNRSKVCVKHIRTLLGAPGIATNGARTLLGAAGTTRSKSATSSHSSGSLFSFLGKVQRNPSIHTSFQGAGPLGFGRLNPRSGSYRVQPDGFILWTGFRSSSHMFTPFSSNFMFSTFSSHVQKTSVAGRHCVPSSAQFGHIAANEVCRPMSHLVHSPVTRAEGRSPGRSLIPHGTLFSGVFGVGDSMNSMPSAALDRDP